MLSKSLLMLTTVIAVSSISCAAIAQTSPAPETRAEVKAETRTAEKAGQLVPAGQGPVFSDSLTRSTKTRADRKAETLAARKAGTLEPAGDADIEIEDRATSSQPTQVNRAARNAETRALEKAGLLTPAGEGPGAPKK